MIMTADTVEAVVYMVAVAGMEEEEEEADPTKHRLKSLPFTIIVLMSLKHSQSASICITIKGPTGSAPLYPTTTTYRERKDGVQ